MAFFGFRFGADVEVDRDGWVTITGIRQKSLGRFIHKMYNSGNFLEKFSKRQWSNSICINQFYIPEMLFLLNKGMEEGYLPAITTSKVVDLIYKNTWFGTSLQEVQTIADMNLINKEMSVKLSDVQEEFIKDVYWQKKVSYQLKGYLLSLQQGLGKAIKHGTPVRVPGGWKNIEDIKIGDEVIAVDGTPSKVNGVFPQGKRTMFRVGFQDGRYLDVDGDHLWTILYHEKVYDNSRYGFHSELKSTTMNTIQLIDRLSRPNWWNTYIPIAESEKTPDVNLPIDPYLLGVLLGDGSLCTADEINPKRPDAISIHSDLEIIERCIEKTNGKLKLYITEDSRNNAEYFRDARFILSDEFTSNIRKELHKLNLMGKHSYDKFIPEIYLNSSTEQRMELLRGLLDTDGYISDPTKSKGRNGGIAKCGSIEYSTASEELAYQIQSLVRSLGGKCAINSRVPYYTYKGQRLPGRINYRVRIKMQKPEDAVTLERKKCRLSNENQYSKYWKLAVTSVTPLIEKVEATCISINHPSKLFVAKDYIVTHNTLTSLALSTALGKKHVAIVAPLSTVNNVWYNEINKWYKRVRKIWTTKLDPIMIKPDTEFVIMNYETIAKITPYIRQNWNPEETMIIVDECHNFKDISSKRTTELVDFCDSYNCNDILLMSGTPIKALGVECIPIFRLLDKFCTPEIVANLKQLNRYTKIMNDLLKNRMGMIMYRKLRKDIMQLPPKIEEELKVKIPNGDDFTITAVQKQVLEFVDERQAYYKKNYKKYEDIYNKCLKVFEGTLQTREERIAYQQYRDNVELIRKRGHGWDNIQIVVATTTYEKKVIIPHLPDHMRAQFRDAKSVIKYVDLKILGEVLGGLLNKLRMEMTSSMIGKNVIDIIEKAEKKTILFSSYVDTIKYAADVCVKYGLKPMVITGENTKETSTLLDKFKTDPTINPLIASLKTLATGHTIIEANTVIFLNVPFRSVDYDQASDRVYRMGQDTEVYIYKLVLDTGDKPNLSTRMQDIIAWSKESFNTIIGDDETDPQVSNQLTQLIPEMHPLSTQAYNKWTAIINNALDTAIKRLKE